MINDYQLYNALCLFISDDAYYEGGEGVGHLSEQGQATLQHLESVFHAGDGDQAGREDEPQIGNRATNGSTVLNGGTKSSVIAYHKIKATCVF